MTTSGPHKVVLVYREVVSLQRSKSATGTNTIGTRPSGLYREVVPGYKWSQGRFHKYMYMYSIHMYMYTTGPHRVVWLQYLVQQCHFLAGDGLDHQPTVVGDKELCPAPPWVVHGQGRLGDQGVLGVEQWLLINVRRTSYMYKLHSTQKVLKGGTVEPLLKETPNKGQDSEHQNFPIVLTHL